MREVDKAVEDVDFKVKKEREREKKGKEKVKKRRDEEDDDLSASSVQSAKEGERRRTRDADERRKREREREEKADVAVGAEFLGDKERERLHESSPSPLPSVDDESSHLDTASSLDPADKATKHRHEVEEWTGNKGVMIRVRCVPLGEEVTKLLEEGRHIIRRMARKRHREERSRRREKVVDASSPSTTIEEPEETATTTALTDGADSAVAPQTVDVEGPPVASPEANATEEEDDGDEGDAVQDEDDVIASRCSHKYTAASFIAALRSLFGSPSCPELSPDDVSHIWSFGPKRYGPNLLLNRTDLSPLTSFISNPATAPILPSSLDLARVALFRGVESGVVNGFQMAAASGPICEEPMMGVAFLVTALTLHATAPSGAVMSSTRSACRRSFLSHTHRLRLLEAVYLVHLQCSSTELGHLYPVLARRRGRIVGEDLQEGTNQFLIVAYLPLAESFGFSSEVRKATGGEAQPQLIFSHWELITQDPFYTPRTEEELERTGVVEEGKNVSREWVEKVRKRKGPLRTGEGRRARGEAEDSRQERSEETLADETAQSRYIDTPAK